MHTEPDTLLSTGFSES